jgi:MtrB/PioB family decaheme-associated outer membrane protein
MKKFISKFGFRAAAFLPVILLGAYSPMVNSQETEPKIYSCKQCVKYTGWLGTLDFGFAYVNNDSLRFGDYRGLEKEGTYAALDGFMHFRELGGNYIDMYAKNFGYDSREFDIRGGNRGFYELRFGWQEIPKYRGYGTQTPFGGVGTDYLALPVDWVHANTTSGMTALQSSLVEAQLKTKRKILDAGATWNFATNFSYRIDYQRQQKKGTRTLGAGIFYTNASILPAPVDFTTDIFDMDLTWSGKHAQVQLGFISSQFDNGNNSLTWNNPFSSSPEQSLLRAALEPGNKFHQFNLSGSYAFTPRIKISGRAAMGRMKQNDPFLPYTSNPIYSDLPLPRESLDGRLDTSTYNLTGKLFARLNNKLSFTARGKWDERDNKTPVDLYTPVVTDLVPFTPRYNRPYSYKRQQYSADLRLRASRFVRISGGARQQNIDRTLQAVERTKETTWWGDVKINPGYTTQVRFKLESAQRDISDYLQPLDGGPVDHPLMRKFNMADRDRERLLVDFDLMPTEAFGINLSYIKAKADYENSPLGVQSSDDQSFSVNLNYAIGSKLNIYGFYTHDDIDAELLSASTNSAELWVAVTRDRISTYGVGLSSQISEKSSLGIDYVSSVSKGEISVQTTDLEDPFDPLRTNLVNLRLHFDYTINDHWGYKLYAEQEEYSSEDWAIDGYGVAGVNSILSMGEVSPDYKVWYYRFQLSYRF